MREKTCKVAGSVNFSKPAKLSEIEPREAGVNPCSVSTVVEEGRVWCCSRCAPCVASARRLADSIAKVPQVLDVAVNVYDLSPSRRYPVVVKWYHSDMSLPHLGPELLEFISQSP